mgnify:CR=1 FL=1
MRLSRTMALSVSRMVRFFWPLRLPAPGSANDAGPGEVEVREVERVERLADQPDQLVIGAVEVVVDQDVIEALSRALGLEPELAQELGVVHSHARRALDDRLDDHGRDLVAAAAQHGEERLEDRRPVVLDRIVGSRDVEHQRSEHRAELVDGARARGITVLLDVVYNHTNSAGQNDKSVLDKIVPWYYHRRNEVSGAVLRDSCCDDTAPEFAMMGKLVVDSTKQWVEQYKLSGFRFDLMGFHPKSNIEAVRERAEA